MTERTVTKKAAGGIVRDRARPLESPLPRSAVTASSRTALPPAPAKRAPAAKTVVKKKKAPKRVSDPMPAATPPPSPESTRGRFARQRGLEEVRAVLLSTGGATVYELAERLDVSVRTVIRYLQALEDAGDGVYDERDGHKKVWRLATTNTSILHLTTTQMTALYLSRRVVDFLAGTGFSEDLEDVFRKLEVTLKRRDFAATQNLDKKLFSVNEAPHKYEGRDEHVNEILTALTKQERLKARHESVGKGVVEFKIEPLTLIVYKKGLYLAGKSLHHGAIRTLALDGFIDLDWCRGDAYTYPADYAPEQLVEGAFGLIGGERTHVRIAFDARVARYVRRRNWHPTQKIEERPDRGLILEMDVKGTVELTSWVLGFGEHAEVLAPATLRAEVARAHGAAAARYAAGP